MIKQKIREIISRRLDLTPHSLENEPDREAMLVELRRQAFNDEATAGTVLLNLGDPEYTKFAWDGWNLVAETTWNGLGQRLNRKSYIWGLDLSGTLQGAGGVGGLLIETLTFGTSAVTLLPSYDGNGNILALLNPADQTMAADYEYGPFGEPLKTTGTYAQANPFRWSSKYTDVETGLVYYGYRYYNPALGKWLSRDPIEEDGGFNLFGMVGNDPVNEIDPFGLITYSFDKATCTLSVGMTWSVSFRRLKGRWFRKGREWTEEEKQLWLRDAKSAVEGYFNRQKMKCKKTDYCCPDGVQIKFDLRYVTSGADYKVYVTYEPRRSNASTSPGRPWSVGNFDRRDPETIPRGAPTQQSPLVHETGHMLGLPHPGQRLPAGERPKSGSPADYSADNDSLMGSGGTLRLIDFEDAFCKHIK